MNNFFTSLLILLTVLNIVLSVDRSKFRTCADTGFCKRYRYKTSNSNEQFSLDSSTISLSPEGWLSGSVNTGESTNQLKLSIVASLTGAIRVRIVENLPRWQPDDILLSDGLVSQPLSAISTGDSRLPLALSKLSSNSYLALAANEDIVVVVHLSPLKIELYRGQNDIHSLSDEERHGGKEVVDYGEDGLAIYADGTKEERGSSLNDGRQLSGINTYAESFQGHTDAMTRGPLSVGVDISFPSSSHVYGLPEHTSPLSLPTTIGSAVGKDAVYKEPYRLYNLDVFDYELNEPMALYGNVPLLLAHGVIDGASVSSGIFWYNPSETFVDISDNHPSEKFKQSHWISESGQIDLFLFSGYSPNGIFKQYAALTGTQQLPPLFALGYHQCRWNYRDERDVATVEKTFEELDYPFDVIWLDIEHTDGKRYFTWDKNVFPNPIEMQRNLSSHGRKMVTIVDPHVKRDSNYYVHRIATEKGYYIKNKDGSDFNGWCWPGDSSYLDFTDASVRAWWAEQFETNNYQGSTEDLFIWNDMNEPSVFNGPEVSMTKEAKNRLGIEHREWHNILGMYMQRATGEGIVRRGTKLREPDSSYLTTYLNAIGWQKEKQVDIPKNIPRSFVLSRAFWAGSQRFGAIWTGDNKAEWGHLAISTPMLLSLNLAGISFSGADVGGFMGDPSAELFTRWYAAGAFNSFFRGHAHHDTKRREPWVYGEPYTSYLRSFAMLRYSLLPYWYTTFYLAYKLGTPVMRAMFVEFPNDANLLSMDDQYLVGDSLLVKPITEAGATQTKVYLPAGSGVWYDLLTLNAVGEGAKNGAEVVLDAPLDKIPVFIRSGKILPRKLRLRRSSKLMFYDPYTLFIALDQNTQSATGLLYLDDEYSTAYLTDPTQYSVRSLVYSNGALVNANANESTGSYKNSNLVERIVIVGSTFIPKRVIVRQSNIEDRELVFNYHNNIITVKKPDVNVSEDWLIVFE
eukprot:gene18695-24452_t